MANAPIASDCAPSNIAVQLVPPSVERQTPPCAVPRYTLLALPGSTTIEVTRPLIDIPAPDDSDCPLVMFVGPSAVHAPPAAGVKLPFTIESILLPLSCRSI